LPAGQSSQACKRLIKNCIICWNYLYLSQKLEEIKDTTEREAFLDAVAHGLAGCLAALQPARCVRFLGRKATGQHGNSAPKIYELNGALFWGPPKTENPIYERDYAKSHVAFGTFVGI
jgi:hypothetical protein